MRTGRALLVLLPAAMLALLLAACGVDLSVPHYALEFRGVTAYPSAAAVSVDFRYWAEDSVHRCRLALTDADGDVLPDPVTKEFSAGVWHAVGCELPELPGAEGRYGLRVTVQVQDSAGEFVDLAFLDKSVDLYVDLTDPAAPTIEPTPAISSHPLSVTLQHPELNSPTGSPVSLYYTLDGSTPSAGSSKFTGSPIVLPVSATPTALKVVAIDAAERASAVQSHSFPFLNILSAVPESPPLTVDGGLQYVQVDGYGFDALDEAMLYDSDNPEGTLGGTAAEALITAFGRTDTHMRIVVDPSSVLLPGSDGTFNSGTGFIWVKDAGTGETDTIAIYIGD